MKYSSKACLNYGAQNILQGEPFICGLMKTWTNFNKY